MEANITTRITQDRNYGAVLAKTYLSKIEGSEKQMYLTMEPQRMLMIFRCILKNCCDILPMHRVNDIYEAIEILKMQTNKKRKI